MLDAGAANPADQFLLDHIKPALKLEKQFQNLRLEFGVALDAEKKAEKKGGPKHQEAARKRGECQSKYEEARTHVMTAVREVDAHKDAAYTAAVEALCLVLHSLRPDWGQPLPDPSGQSFAVDAASSGPPARPDNTSQQPEAAGEWDVAAAGQVSQSQEQVLGQGEDPVDDEAPEDGSGQAFEVDHNSQQHQQPRQGIVRVMRAVHAHVAEGNDEISMVPGDLLEVLDDTTEGWWTARNRSSGAVGLFPVNYCEEVRDE